MVTIEVTIDVTSGDALSVTADVLVVGVFTGGIGGPGVDAVIDRLGLPSLPLTPQFRGDIGQHLLVASPELASGSVLFVGLGRMNAADAARLRDAATIAAASGALWGRVVTTLAQVHPTPDAIAAIAEGIQLGAWTDRRFKTATDERPTVEHLTIMVPSAAVEHGGRAVRRATAIAAAVDAARSLVTTPPNHQSPGMLASQLTQLTAGTCDADLHDAAALQRAGFGGVLSVGRGAAAPPCLVELRYEPSDPLGHVVLCGKGTTFASGGLALHHGDRMAQGKADMAGAATIAAACSVLDALDVRVRVTALLGLVEAMPGGDAQRPGDVVTTRGGATIEIMDAAADTPLVLADLLDLARAFTPDAVVDVTTGGVAAGAALGRHAGAVMGSDQQLVDALLTAGAIAGEPLWQLPLWDDVDRRLDSAVADVVNANAAVGGAAIVTGLVLRRFAKGMAWAHLDCGGPALVADTAGHDGIHRPGATGYGVRTLLAWLEHHTAHAA